MPLTLEDFVWDVFGMMLDRTRHAAVVRALERKRPHIEYWLRTPHTNLSGRELRNNVWQTFVLGDPDTDRAVMAACGGTRLNVRTGVVDRYS